MVYRSHRKEISTSRTERSFGESCRHCGRNYWEKLSSCPYCGASNTTGGGTLDTSSSNSFVDPRNNMRLLGNSFYYLFLLLSLICGVLIIVHDVIENVVTHYDSDAILFQTKTRIIFWVIYIIQQIMFCFWLMIHYNALSTLHIRKRFSGILAWTTFIPVVNLYFPQAMVKELWDRLYYLKIPNINIRFVPIWWFFQCIAFIYLITSSLFSFWNDYFFLTVIAEIIWGIAIFCQGYLLFGFNSSINTVGHRHARSSRVTSMNSAAERRARHRR